MADTSSGSAKAGFNIPKIKKTNKDNLQIVGLNTRDVKELLLDINKHCLNTNFMSEIEVISVKMVHNSELMDKYYKKKGELKDQGRSNASLTDQLGFLHMKHYLLNMVVKNGLCCAHQHFNRLVPEILRLHINGPKSNMSRLLSKRLIDSTGYNPIFPHERAVKACMARDVVLWEIKDGANTRNGLGVPVPLY